MLRNNKRFKNLKWHNISLAMIVLTTFIILSVSVLIDKIPVSILYLYLCLSLFTFIIYALDKLAAKKGNWRIPEKTLHVFSLAGGWPGALIAQQILRHKSQKQPFRFIYWLTVILNCIVLAWFYTSAGQVALQKLINDYFHYLS